MADEDTLLRTRMPSPGTLRNGGDKQTLVERMAQARERTAAARVSRVSRGGASAAATLALPAESAAPASPAKALPASKLAAPAKSGPGGWLVQARPGDVVNLMPGQMHFGSEAASVRTLLGSCVAVTLWHPGRRLGGMCHFLLPTRNRSGREPLDGKYGDEAIEAMVERLQAARTAPGEYEAHLYGGADTMPEGSGVKFNVGQRNIELGWSLIDRYGFQLQGVDVGEDVPRTVTLTLATGQVEMRRGGGAAPAHPLVPRPGGGRRS